MGELQRLGWRDALVPAGLLVLGAVELVTTTPGQWGWGLALEASSAVLLVGRRRAPLVLSTLAIVVLLLMPWIGPALDQAAAPIMFMAVAVYSLARWVPDYRGLVGVAAALLMLLGDYAFVDSRGHDVSDVFFVLALVIPPYVLGRITRRLADHNALLRQNQELVRRDAVRGERDRIAREMHDVIAHSISAMVVQTSAAEDLVRTDPDRAARVLGEVAATGRRALVETGKLLHVLRDEADEMALGPAPGVDDLPTLVKGFRDSGLDVDLDLPEALPPLSPGVDVSVYRIVQEALTNALKHGSGRTASVRVSSGPGTLAIDATNPTGSEAAGGGSGLGLLGMAERVSLLGGRLTHGCDGDQFRVSVTVPVETA
jgi:signal transduction histidine kinase